jgi:signal transduction histidine kinase/DNA-binding NarL/FixJ family response regulator
LNSTELLSYLSDLELKLNDFSFDELSFSEITKLKKSINSLEHKLDKKSVSIQGKKSIRKKNNQSNRDNNSQEMLIAKVSHEIRTPLNGIIGFTELLSEEKLSKTQHSHVGAIKTASNNLLTIINELLEYSKLSSGTSHFESVEFNFNNLITDVSYLCETLIVNPKVSFSVSIANNIPKILKGDPSKLSQILLNLIGNAIKFVEEGSIVLTVGLNKQENENLVLDFQVKDTGIGIANKNLKNIFDYYQQAEVDTQKNYGGTGLGLSIVKHIIQSLDGNLSVESELGVGTTFSFSMPYKVSEFEVLKDSSISVYDYKEYQNRIKKMSFLVFEDNMLNQKLIQNRLENWGCTCYVTDNIENGFQVLENEKIDLILMDLRMPEISGFEVSKKIRKNKSSRINTIPIIALTADFTIKDKKLCAESGINDFILKPFNSKKLLIKLTSKINHLNTISSLISAPVVSKINEEDQSDIDFSNVLKECFGDVNVLEELVRLYKNNAIEFIGKTKVDLKKSNFEGVRFNTHKIKAGLKMMKTFSLLRIVEQMNIICKEEEQDLKYLNFLYDCFLREYAIVENAIDNYVEKHKK